MDFRRQREGESDSSYRRRIATEGNLIRAQVSRLITMEAYRKADRERRADLITEAISKIRSAYTRKVRSVPRAR